MIDFLRKKVFIPIQDKRNKNKQFYYLPRVAKVLDGSREEIREYQLDKFKSLVIDAYENVPFYKKLYDQNDIDVYAINDESDIQKIPIVRKSDIRANMDSFLSKKYSKDELYKSATGGTTSSPISLYYDNECFSQKRACTQYFYKWFGYELGEKIVYLWRAEQDIPPKKTIRRDIVNYLTKRTIMLPSSYLDEKMLFDYYITLKKYNPKLLISYPSSLYILAHYLEKNEFSLSLNKIAVVAECLYDYQREKIEETFGQKIFDWYGARELGHIGTECSAHKGMHVNAYGLYIEIVKDNKQVFDEEGAIIATDLLNDGTPLIRYKIEDVGKISTRQCICGSHLPILEELSGRLTDIFKMKDGTMIPGVSFVNRVVTECKGITELQIVQKDYELFELNIVKGTEFSEDSISRIKDKICFYAHQGLNFKVNFVTELPIEKSGKVRFCKCEIED